MMRLLTGLVILLLATPVDAAGRRGEQADYAADRQRLLDEIAADYRATERYTHRRSMSPEVRRAMGAVPRHAFVKADPSLAYGNYPLSIGYGQTISQPYIVAIMTDLLDAEPGQRVLEIGTGSGYQAAVLAELDLEVYTIEIVEPLARAAERRLAELGYGAVHVLAGDGNLGWPSAAPFDAIIVTAGGRVPPALVEQLKPGGRMVIPVDEGGGDQMLTVITREAGGGIRQRRVLPVRFVPLTGDTQP